MSDLKYLVTGDDGLEGSFPTLADAERYRQLLRTIGAKTNVITHWQDPPPDPDEGEP